MGPRYQSSTYTDREMDLIQEGYDPSHAAEIAADEAGREEEYEPGSGFDPREDG